ncbi:hypothetical protein [Streptomyces azureus]|uniref:Uncharacterized protein n=1 Tax=Streptomyces azureus TaxID=146537 RepID=A0A0K8PZF7_STRAJ|nr:hypothetical protein [Streptomyces azureus]GAP53093.1 uncharacterized protein SAZU_7973 [Streptomyces azureus]
MDRLRAQLTRFEDAFPGFRTEIVEGSVVASPVRPFDGETVQRLWTIVEPAIDSSLGKLTIPTARLPVDPKARHRT